MKERRYGHGFGYGFRTRQLLFAPACFCTSTASFSVLPLAGLRSVGKVVVTFSEGCHDRTFIRLPGLATCRSRTACQYSLPAYYLGSATLLTLYPQCAFFAVGQPAPPYLSNDPAATRSLTQVLRLVTHVAGVVLSYYSLLTLCVRICVGDYNGYARAISPVRISGHVRTHASSNVYVVLYCMYHICNGMAVHGPLARHLARNQGSPPVVSGSRGFSDRYNNILMPYRVPH